MATTAKKSRRKRRKKSQAPAMVLLCLLGVLMLGIFLLHRVLAAHTEDITPSAAFLETSPVATAQSLTPSPLIAACFGEAGGYKTYSDDSGTAQLGIDVSTYQDWIDWAAVAESGIDYVMIRAGYRGYTDGDINQDNYFRYNLDSATAQGLDVGIYFFSQAMSEAEAIEEAQTVLDLVAGYDLQYPIYFDWETVEDQDARTSAISGSDLTRYAKAFCSTIEAAGYQAGIYFNLSTAAHLYHLYDLQEYDFWLAEYEDTPSFPYQVAMWQYTDQGTVPGISQPVDLNLSFP